MRKASRDRRSGLFLVVTTCLAADLPTREAARAPVIAKAAPAGPTVAGPRHTKLIEAGPQTLAALEIAGNPATGEFSVTQVPLLGRDGWPKVAPNALFEPQVSGDCTGGEVGNPLPQRMVTATLRMTSDYESPMYICDAALQVAASSNVSAPTSPAVVDDATRDAQDLPDTSS